MVGFEGSHCFKVCGLWFGDLSAPCPPLQGGEKPSTLFGEDGLVCRLPQYPVTVMESLESTMGVSLSLPFIRGSVHLTLYSCIAMGYQVLLCSPVFEVG